MSKSLADDFLKEIERKISFDVFFIPLNKGDLQQDLYEVDEILIATDADFLCDAPQEEDDGTLTMRVAIEARTDEQLQQIGQKLKVRSTAPKLKK